jgi:hypothetical protein
MSTPAKSHHLHQNTIMSTRSKSHRFAEVTPTSKTDALPQELRRFICPAGRAGPMQHNAGASNCWKFGFCSAVTPVKLIGKGSTPLFSNLINVTLIEMPPEERRKVRKNWPIW